MIDALVVGAGFAGAVTAERLASSGLTVTIVERRSHVGGNAHDYYNEEGVLVHSYGPHIFHTNSPLVWDYLSQFTSWRNYEHRVRAVIDGQELPIPINRTTLNLLYDLDLKDEDAARRFLNSRAVRFDRVETSEQAVVAKVGWELYEKFFKGYTTKQWGLSPSELHASVCARIPTRTNTDDRYFTDRFQALPRDGYTEMFGRLLSSPRIQVHLDTEFEEFVARPHRHLVWTGPIDEYFKFQFGHLPYRSLRFVSETVPTRKNELLQSVGSLNHPSTKTEFTRVTEYRHLTGQELPYSTLQFEYPSACGDPYYPVPRDANRKLYRSYARLARRTTNVTFIGRLARYQYLNMDQVVAQALRASDKLVERLKTS